MWSKIKLCTKWVCVLCFCCRVYNVRKHPKVANGKWTEEQAFADFLKTFDSPDDPDGKVSSRNSGLHFPLSFSLSPSLLPSLSLSSLPPPLSLSSWKLQLQSVGEETELYCMFLGVAAFHHVHPTLQRFRIPSYWFTPRILFRNIMGEIENFNTSFV